MQPDKSSLSKDDNGKSQSTVIRSIVNRRLLCVSRIEHTIECSNYTLLAKGRASEFYTIFDNETSLPPSETHLNPFYKESVSFRNPFLHPTLFL